MISLKREAGKNKTKFFQLLSQQKKLQIPPTAQFPQNVKQKLGNDLTDKIKRLLDRLLNENEEVDTMQVANEFKEYLPESEQTHLDRVKLAYIIKNTPREGESFQEVSEGTGSAETRSQEVRRASIVRDDRTEDDSSPER